MCGIYGVLGETRADDDKLIQEMDRLLFHRGPDENGCRSGPSGMFGMRRLSIVDLAGGTQPIANEDGSVWVVFNGEIYNHKELRAELERAGHHFATRADTEVIVHGYELWGDAVVEHLRGMFAFAIVDERRARTLFARDHIGKKPLYLRADGRRLVFASELKAIVADPSFVKRLSREAFWHYLTFKNVTPPLCIYEGVVQLPPATRAVWDAHGLRTQSYWRPRFDGRAEIDEESAAGTVLSLLTEAIRKRLFVADVPVGAYLSGGIDSSLVVGIAAGIMPRPIDTFSLGYKEQVAHKSDVGFARQMARQFGTNHHELFIGVDDIIAGIPAVIDSFDEPFGAVTSTYYLSELIRHHVKVAITGDGADELFGSYANHRMAAVVEHLRATTSRGAADFGTFEARRQLALDCASEPDNVWRTRFAGFNDAEKLLLIRDGDGMAPSAERLRGFYDEATGDLVNRTLEVDCRTLLPDQILTYVDRLSMAHSVEARAPFLDLDLVEFAGRLPGRYKVTLTKTKAILKQAARGILPPEILERPKEGFVLPIDAWLNSGLRKLIDEVSSETWLRHGLFDSSAVQTFVDAHRTGSVDNTYKLWTFVNFQLWYARCMDSSYAALPVAEEIVTSA